MAKLTGKESKTGKKPALHQKAQAPASSITEHAMSEIKRSLEGKNFQNMDDLRAFLGTLTDAGNFPDQEDVAMEAKDEAQELAFDAMEAASPAQARKLAKRALAKDPDCVDALVLLNSLDARTPAEAIEGLQKAVAAGERALGGKFTKDNKGHFWLILETRPYMRALGELANMLRGEGRHAEAIETYEKMLELNPNDNQGVRDPLLGLYLVTGNLVSAGKLLKRYNEDSLANFAWARVLERFLSNDRKGAGAALKAARTGNRFVELYMSGKKAVPRNLPEMYSPGSEEEAILCVDMLASAWAAHPEAVLWLATQVQEEELQAKILKMTPSDKNPTSSATPRKKKTGN